MIVVYKYTRFHIDVAHVKACLSVFEVSKLRPYLSVIHFVAVYLVAVLQLTKLPFQHIWRMTQLNIYPQRKRGVPRVASRVAKRGQTTDAYIQTNGWHSQHIM
jgi:hypothetical protein